MKKTCENCNHWKKDTEYDIGYGRCNMVIIDDKKKDEKQDRMFYDGCTWDGEILTGHGFGCIHFEEK